jgi:hypothetical protein
MTRFSKAVLKDGKLVETDVREIAQSDLLACPHTILMAEHYRPDGSCRCNDPEHTIMREWGYRWKDGAWS